MTVSSTSTHVEYTAAGTSGENFTVPYRFSAATELQVLEAGVVQVLGTDYNVTGGDPTGTVTWIGSPTATAKIEIDRVTASTQAGDYLEAGRFPAETHEDLLDKAIMLLQERLAIEAAGVDYDAGIGLSGTRTTRKIRNVTDPTDAQDAATRNFVNSQIAASTVGLPAGIAGDENRYLQLDGALAADWRDGRIPIPVAADVTANRILEASVAAGVGVAYALRDQRTVNGNVINAIINGDFKVAQRGTTFDATTIPLNSDDTWLLDRWLLLSDGNDIVDVTQRNVVDHAADIPDGAYAVLRGDVETINKKFGFATILEARDTLRLVDEGNGVVSLSFRAKSAAGPNDIENIRVAIMEWAGAADAVTSDLVGASWNAEGADPDLPANWTRANTPADIALTSSWQTFTVPNITLTNGTVNLAVFIWVDDTDAALGDLIYLADVQLEAGPIVNPIGRRPFAEELAMCERYYQTTYDHGTAIGTVTDVGAVEERLNTTSHIAWIALRTTMRAAPTVTGYNPNSGAAGTWRNTGAPADLAFTPSDQAQSSFHYALAASNADQLMNGHYTADAEL